MQSELIRSILIIAAGNSEYEFLQKVKPIINPNIRNSNCKVDIKRSDNSSNGSIPKMLDYCNRISIDLNYDEKYVVTDYDRCLANSEENEANTLSERLNIKILYNRPSLEATILTILDSNKKTYYQNQKTDKLKKELRNTIDFSKSTHSISGLISSSKFNPTLEQLKNVRQNLAIIEDLFNIFNN
ncbi:MAG: hypothetical protein QM538_03320 [Methylacidiphilales bacterium]|nr:hypothetical protein [Candidatus Methylacidiphilales bacterium]